MCMTFFQIRSKIKKKHFIRKIGIWYCGLHLVSIYGVEHYYTARLYSSDKRDTDFVPISTIAAIGGKPTKSIA